MSKGKVSVFLPDFTEGRLDTIPALFELSKIYEPHELIEIVDEEGVGFNLEELEELQEAFGIAEFMGIGGQEEEEEEGSDEFDLERVEDEDDFY